MRARLRDDLHALRRPGAVAAIGAALGGMLALRAPTAPAWALVATVDALGTADESTVATLTASQTTSVARAAWVLGALVVAVALLLAIDRPPRIAEPVLLVAAVGMLAVTMSVLVARPTPADFLGHREVADLVAGEQSLPAGIDIDLAVQPTAGPMLLGLAAMGVVIGTVLATRRG